MSEETLSPAGPPERLKSLGRLLTNSARFVTAIAEADLAAYDLTLPQWVALNALWRADGLTVSHLADYCCNGQPALSRLLDRMESKGLVKRRTSEEDRRAIRVYLTDKGRGLDHLADRYLKFNATMTQGLSEEEIETLFALLEKVYANGEAATKSG